MNVKDDDMPALESWLREKALEAHRAGNGILECKDCPAVAVCDRTDAICEDVALIYGFAMNETIAMIQNARQSQRPHVGDII